MLQKFFIYSEEKINTSWQTFQFYKPIYSSMWWSGEWCRRLVLISPTHIMLLWGKIAWQIQMPYMDIIRAMHYSLNVPYLYPQYVSFTPSYILVILVLCAWKLIWYHIVILNKKLFLDFLKCHISVNAFEHVHCLVP